MTLTFKPGDRVRLTTADSFDGKCGRVERTFQDGSCIIDVDGEALGGGICFRTEEISPEVVIRRRLTVTRADGRSSAGWRVTNDGVEHSFEGEFDFEVEEIDPHIYVQVDYSGIPAEAVRWRALYTYIDPTGGRLHIGDEVEIPVTYGTKVGVVRAYGRGGYIGPCKTVIARITREALR